MAEEKIGRYVVERTLGRGAMGVVYLAFDPVLDRHSAIKVMTTSGEVDEELRTRFFREARSAAKIRHPNIIAIYDMGEDRNRPFIAMEYLEGEDLKTLLEKKVFIPFEQKLDLAIQVCRGLHYAHQHGVVHRDVKPANIFLTREGEVRILDFGLARLGSSELTRAGMLMGTPYYMSPEQVRGSRELDGRSDLFSLAVVLYELVSHVRPFEADTPTGVLFKIVSEPHVPLSQILPGCAEELVQILDRALSKDREARFASCHELAEALRAFRDGLADKQQALCQRVQSLQKEFEASQEDSVNRKLLDTLDVPLSGVEELSVDPMETAIAYPASFAQINDYGDLLLHHARLEQELEIINRRVAEGGPLVELFDRSRQLFVEGNYDLCLDTLEKILREHPENAKARQMQRECLAHLEERRREEDRRVAVNAALLLAQDALTQGDYAQCMQRALEILNHEPGNSEAMKLHGLASRTFENQKRIDQCIAQASEYLQNENYQGCWQVTSEALGIKPDHPQLRELQARAQQGLDRRHRIDELLKTARQQEEKGDFEASYQAAARALDLDPGNAELRELHGRSQQGLEKRRSEEERRARMSELLSSAREGIQTNRFSSTLRAVGTLLEMEPEHGEAVELKHRAEAALAPRRRKVRRAMALVIGAAAMVCIVLGMRFFFRPGRELLHAPNPTQVQISGPAPSATATPPVREQAAPNQDSQIDRDLDAATRLFETQKYSEAVEEIRKLLARYPGNPEAERLLQRGVEMLERIERGNRRAKYFFESEKYDDAIASLGEVLKIAPSNTEARQLLAKLERHARKGAEDARAEMVKARSAAESAKAQQLARGPFEAARNLELVGVRLFEARQYGQAIPKLFEAGRSYNRAEKEAVAERDSLLTAQKEREQAAEQSRQLAAQQEAVRKQAQGARLSYNRALERATKAGAGVNAPELFRGALSVATEAQAKWDRGDYLGAQHDFEAASDSMERAGTRAEEAVQQKGLESDRRVSELTQRGADRQAILDVLTRYAEAYENRDLMTFKNLRPTLGEKEEKKLKEFFRIARSIKVDLQPIADPQFAGDTATVICRLVVQFADEHGLKKPTETNTRLSLRKKGSSWIIEEMRQTAAP